MNRKAGRVEALARAVIDSLGGLDDGGLAAQVSRDPRLVLRESPGHVTASVVAVDPDRRRVLLVHHAKAGVWAQPGGHLEPERDGTPLEAALRELREETGVQPLQVLAQGRPVQVMHYTDNVFGGCRAHHDLVYVALADPEQQVQNSPESHAAQWFSIDSLPAAVATDLPDRLPGLARVQPFSAPPASANPSR